MEYGYGNDVRCDGLDVGFGYVGGRRGVEFIDLGFKVSVDVVGVIVVNFVESVFVVSCEVGILEVFIGMWYVLKIVCLGLMFVS